MEQLHLDRPFGIETMRAMIDFVPGDGWAWSLLEYVGGTRIILACGTARSARSAVLAVADALVDEIDGAAPSQEF